MIPEKTAVKLGIETLCTDKRELLRGRRAGIICNQASVDHGFTHSADLLTAMDDVELAALFGPQHGVRGDVQDNMVETGHSEDRRTGLPVYSLYSETRKPTAEMLAGLDTLVFDLQDIGCRVYTFIYTMSLAMTACAEAGVRFIVCDRPNPIGGTEVEGSKLQIGHESFVGQYPIPMRHGMTTGELALMFNENFGIGCDLEVVRMAGWKRSLYYDETDGPWVMPSPNMPTVDTAVVFPGTVYLEGTKISEGRGTTRPFEILGAPYIDAEFAADRLNARGVPGVHFRPTGFQPTFQKHAGKGCGGVFLHVTDRRKFKPVFAAAAVLSFVHGEYREEFEWKEPPYEYEFDRNPFDVIDGGTSFREAIESGASAEEIAVVWVEDETEFRKAREPFLLYD